MYRNIALAALILILVVVNWSIYQKEHHLAEGKVVYLELAPVDPRSLMQGDYMALRFQLANEVYKALPKKTEPERWRHDVKASNGEVVVQLDEQNIGTFIRIHDEQPLARDEILMRYRVRNGEVKFATNAFFFQEGHAKYYQPARYGQFRVDDSGELLLVAMYDKDLNKIGPESENL
jgi:uncharacterized membrane-anchored protein